MKKKDLTFVKFTLSLQYNLTITKNKKMENLQFTNNEKESLNDLFDFIILKNLEVDTEEKFQNALNLWIKSKTEFYSKMINKNGTKTDLLNNVGEKMFNNYLQAI